MEGCEGCHTYIKYRKLGGMYDIFSFCPVARRIERKEVEECPCYDCLVKCVCITPCENYLVVKWD
jgi:hypothetical protein